MTATPAPLPSILATASAIGKRLSTPVSTRSLSRCAGSPCSSRTNEYNLLRDGMKTAGFQNFSDYITTPDKVPPPQPRSHQDGRSAKRRPLAANAANDHGRRQRAAHVAEAQFDQVKMQLDELNFHLKALLTSNTEKRKDKEVDARIDVAEREVTMLEKQPITTETGTVSAH